MRKAVVAIDGASGTVGLDLRRRLARQKPGYRVLELSRNTPPVDRQAALGLADVVVLCLPEEAARKAAQSISSSVRVIDASSTHRLQPGWVYGLPELCLEQSELIQKSFRVANPGCFASAAVLLLRPLNDKLPSTPIPIVGVGGFTSGGKKLVAAAETTEIGYRLYGLQHDHRHIPEIQKFGLLKARPIFMPGVAGFSRGTLVQVPVHLPTLGMSLLQLEDAFEQAYASFSASVRVCKGTTARYLSGAFESDGTTITILPDPTGESVLLVAQFDNLGKGAAGSVIANLELMLGDF